MVYEESLLGYTYSPLATRHFPAMVYRESLLGYTYSPLATRHSPLSRYGLQGIAARIYYHRFGDTPYCAMVYRESLLGYTFVTTHS